MFLRNLVYGKSEIVDGKNIQESVGQQNAQIAQIVARGPGEDSIV